MLVAVGRRALCQKASAARRTPSRGRPPPFGLGRGRRAGRPTNLLTRQTGENRATKALLRPRFEAGAAMGAFNAPPCAPGSTGGAKGASNARPALNTASDECDQPHGQRRNVPRDGRHHAAHDRLRRSPAHASPSRRESWQPSRRAGVHAPPPQRAAVESADAHRCAHSRHGRSTQPRRAQWSECHTRPTMAAGSTTTVHSMTAAGLGCSARTRRASNAGLARAHADTDPQYQSTVPRAAAVLSRRSAASRNSAKRCLHTSPRAA